MSPAFFFRATVKSGRQVQLLIDFTDDRLNSIEWTQNFVFP